MGRPPSNMGGVNKKGSWTPEEDLLLLSYVQENGPGDWKSVSENAGLQRCGRSCRLRWKNYLRPEIKRGDFTAEEDEKIMNLQALFGNKWAAIANYLPNRTDNDIKNYWNTRLKKKANGAVPGGYVDDGQSSNSNAVAQSDNDTNLSKDVWVRRLQNNVHMAKEALFSAISNSPMASTHDLGIVTSPESLVFSSPLLMGTNSLHKKVNSEFPGGYVDDGQGSNTVTQSDNDTNLPKDVWARRLQNNVHTTNEALFNAISNSSTTSTHDLGVVTSPDSLVFSSPFLMGTNSLHTSTLASFDSPHAWNMKVNDQDLLNTEDEYHLRNYGPPPISQALNYSKTSYPCSVGNITQWLQKWTSEYPNKENAAGHTTNFMKSKLPMISDEEMINKDRENAMVPFFTSMENSIVHDDDNYTSPETTIADPSPPINVLNRQHEENNVQQMLNLSTPYDPTIFW